MCDTVMFDKSQTKETLPLPRYDKWSWARRVWSYVHGHRSCFERELIF